MKEYEILSQGEKIKRIRDRFGFKQEDITGGEITRNLISIIENNKANLTETVAEILANNINSICKCNKIDFKVTKEFLLEDIETQAKIVADDYISYIRNLDKNKIIEIDDTLMEIELFLKNYNGYDKKPMLYMEIGYKFKEINMYSVASKYFLKAYETSHNVDITSESLIKLGSCDIYLSNYKEALNYFEILLKLATNVEDKYIATFNIALCYKKLNQYEKSLEVLETITEEYDHILKASNHLKINLLKGICLNELSYFNKAIIVYNTLLEGLSDNEHMKDKLLVMSNLADVYSKTKDMIKLNKICSKMLKIINSKPSVLVEYDCDIRLSLFNNLRASNFDDKEVLTNLLMVALESFKNGTSYACIDDIEKVLINLLNIFIINNDVDKIDKLKNDVFEMIKNNKFPKCNMIILKFINYYNHNNEREEISNIIRYISAC